MALDYITTDSVSTGYVPFMILALICVRTKMPTLSFLQVLTSTLALAGFLIGGYLYLPILWSFEMDANVALSTLIAFGSVLISILASIISGFYGYIQNTHTYFSIEGDNIERKRSVIVNPIHPSGLYLDPLMETVEYDI